MGAMHDNDAKYKLTLYKMAEFKDGIPILIHCFEISKDYKKSESI